MTEQSIDRAPRAAGGPAPARRRLALRGLLAALGAGLLARTTTEPAQAANGDTVVAGNTVSATSPTTVQGPVSGNAVLRATNGFTGGLDAKADGLQGYAAGADQAGGFGRNNDLNGIGLAGAAPHGTGVYGESLGGTGVGGKSSSGTAVRGESGSGHGVYGRTESGPAGLYGSSDTKPGVYGKSLSSYGLQGYSQSSAAVLGSSDTNNGVYGYSAGHKGTSGVSDTGYGVHATSNSGTGLYAKSTSGQAAQFDGDVVINGELTVSNLSYKAAAVPHPDGSTRRLYCMESPECWFEDFGDDSLRNGRAEVKLERDFAAVVRTASYRVYLTAEGDCKGLYVASKGASGFEVREQQGGSSNVAFSYRVVARRKDVEGPRLEKVKPPKPLSADELRDSIDPKQLGPRP